jgi:hypothetical protein
MCPNREPPSERHDLARSCAVIQTCDAQTEEEQFEYEKMHFLAVMPEKVLVALPNAELPELITMVTDGILKASDLSNDEAQVGILMPLS